MISVIYVMASRQNTRPPVRIGEPIRATHFLCRLDDSCASKYSCQ